MQRSGGSRRPSTSGEPEWLRLPRRSRTSLVAFGEGERRLKMRAAVLLYAEAGVAGRMSSTGPMTSASHLSEASCHVHSASSRSPYAMRSPSHAEKPWGMRRALETEKRFQEKETKGHRGPSTCWKKPTCQRTLSLHPGWWCQGQAWAAGENASWPTKLTGLHH